MAVYETHQAVLVLVPVVSDQTCYSAAGTGSLVLMLASVAAKVPRCFFASVGLTKNDLYLVC
jgi:hypothetical protein